MILRIDASFWQIAAFPSPTAAVRRRRAGLMLATLVADLGRVRSRTAVLVGGLGGMSRRRALLAASLGASVLALGGGRIGEAAAASPAPRFDGVTLNLASMNDQFSGPLLKLASEAKRDLGLEV